MKNLARKQRFAAFEEAIKRGPYDEYPMLPSGVDPQVCLSRNNRIQPFYLICEHDTVLVNMSGEGRVEFIVGPVRYHELVPGDFVYVPAGTAHRIFPEGECVHLRYKPEHPGFEAVAWYCEECGQELTRSTWDTAVELPQEGYLRACQEYNASADIRMCSFCQHSHAPIDLSPFNWGPVAQEIREDLESTQ